MIHVRAGNLLRIADIVYTLADVGTPNDFHNLRQTSTWKNYVQTADTFDSYRNV